MWNVDKVGPSVWQRVQGPHGKPDRLQQDLQQLLSAAAGQPDCVRHHSLHAGPGGTGRTVGQAEGQEGHGKGELLRLLCIHVCSYKNVYVCIQALSLISQCMHNDCFCTDHQTSLCQGLQTPF